MAIQLRSGLITCILILFGSNDAKQSDDLYIANTIGNKDVPNGIENKSFNYQMKRALTRSDNEGEETTSTEHPMLRPLICTFVPSIPECFFYSTIKPPVIPKEVEAKINPNSSTITYYEEIEPEDKPKKSEEGNDIYRLKHVIKMLCKTVLNILRR